jgi:hypothetical protein
MRITLPLLPLLAAAVVAPAQTVKVETTTVQSETIDAGTSPVIRGDGLKRTVQCNRARVTVDGSGNEVVMRGPCERVAIHGSNHRVTIEEVGTLSVLGSGHKVQWVRGLDGKDPKITQGASDSSVVRISPEDFARLPVPTSRP